jgi:sugar lactone lactonase YvrE
MYKRTLLATSIVVAVGCSGKKKTEGLEPPQETPTTPGSAGSAGSGSGSAAAGAPEVGKVPAVIREAGLMTPESVLHDADADVYLVSNINGKPLDADDNGFISRVTPDDLQKIELKWIDGSKPDVKLDAPKGMAISGGVLWVADITVVRKFDAKTGKPMGEVKVPGAGFLNDVAPAADGGILVTDSGLNAKFEASGTDAVYSISKAGAVKPLIKGKDLGGPNGVIAVGDTVWVTTFRSGAVFEVPKTGEPKPVKLPKGQLDGIVALENGEFLVSSWEGKTVFQGKGDQWKDLKLDLESPADIGWDSKRKKLLVPQFQKDAVSIIEP